MRMLEAFQGLDHLQCTSSFFLIKRWNVDASYHLVDSGLLITDYKNFSITFTKVKWNNHVWIVLRVRRASAALRWLMSMKHGIVMILSPYFLALHWWLVIFEVIRWWSVLGKVICLVVRLMREIHIVFKWIVVHHILLWRLLFVPLVVPFLLDRGERRKRWWHFLMGPDCCGTLALLLLPHIIHFSLVVPSTIKVYLSLKELLHLL